MPDEKAPVILINGDGVMDWNLMSIQVSSEINSLNIKNFTRISSMPGGVFLLADLISAIIKEIAQSSNKTGVEGNIFQPQHPIKPILPGDQRLPHSCAVWARFPYGEATLEEQKRLVWRVREFQGLDPSFLEIPQTGQTRARQINCDDTPDPDFIVLDDANLGFRGDEGLWPKSLFHFDHPKRPWVILKTCQPLGSGILWEFLHKNWSDRLIIVFSIDDLRLSEVHISRDLSWERTAQDVAWELVYNPLVNSLSDCAHVVISFRNAGAILVTNPSGEIQKQNEKCIPKTSLFFDPLATEGSFEQRHKGMMMGYSSCLVAGILRQMVLNSPNIEPGITSGLSAMRRLHQDGYIEQKSENDLSSLAFPLETVVSELVNPTTTFNRVMIPAADRRFTGFYKFPLSREKQTENWTILKELYSGDLEKVAKDIVESGVEVALKGVPVGQFGKLLTVDRREIEAFRSIRSLINEYCSRDHPERPLSIAVFGPPGSGKSFGIKQVARTLRPGEIEDMTFNLSQMKSPEELYAAFHQVRDKVLTGKIPLVFWDEFDSDLDGRKLGWLRYFLAPMQDGEFSQGQLHHPIGRSIFAFAGGTSHTLQDFSAAETDAERSFFTDAKGPDFISRLRGFVNILGANPSDKLGQKFSGRDPYYLIRRAVLIRSILSQSAPQLFEKPGGKGRLRIDQGLLRALILTSVYRHGARSIEAIINMSMLSGKMIFGRSSLPSETQLNLHVDGSEFLSLVQSIVMEGSTLESLAEANHDVFCENLLKEGYHLGDKRDNTQRLHPLLVPYDDLPEEFKESNRNSVREIPIKLSQVGYLMIPARNNEPPEPFPADILETLAEMEHDRYIRKAVSSGWRYENVSIKEYPADPSLIPWKKMTPSELEQHYEPEIVRAMGTGELSEFEKNKDRDLVRSIPTLLSRIGYTIIRLAK